MATLPLKASRNEQRSVICFLWGNWDRKCYRTHHTVQTWPPATILFLVQWRTWAEICIWYWFVSNWRAPWKNRISSTSMKLRKSLVKPVTHQNISSCSVLSPKIVMHNAFNVILWTSTDICVIVHDDLGWKNQTTRYILPCHWLYEWFLSAANVRRYMRRAWQSWVKEMNNTL